MYRDELAAHRARFEAARQQVADAWERLGAKLTSMQALNEQLAQVRQLSIELPTLAPPHQLGPLDPAATGEDYLRASSELERELERLEADAKWLRKVNGVLEARSQGRHADLPLASPPRRVPWSYLLAEWLGLPPMVLLFVGIFGSVGVGVLAGALASAAAASLAPTILVAIVLGVLFAVARVKLRFLATCMQADEVTLLSKASTSGSYKNWNLPVARGWEVTHESYTGSGIVSSLKFLTEDGRDGTAEVEGRPYESGVVLYDPRSLRGYCVCKFRCAPHPDARGRWKPGLSAGLTVRVAITVLLAAVGLAAPLLVLL